MARQAPHADRSPVDRLLFDMHDLIGMLLLGETLIRDMIRDGRFPAPIYVTPDLPRWTLGQIEGWLLSRELEAEKPDPGLAGGAKKK